MSKLRMLPVNEYRVNHWGLLLGLDKRRGQKLNKREGEEEQKVLGRRPELAIIQRAEPLYTCPNT
jgi:hypothetical protein